MISYYGAVVAAGMILLGVLWVVYRKRRKEEKKLIISAVGVTTVIALLLPTLLDTFTLWQTVLLMAVLAAMAGALVPVEALLPVENMVSMVSEDERLDFKRSEAPQEEISQVMTEEPSGEEIPAVMVEEAPNEEISAIRVEEVLNEEIPVITSEETADEEIPEVMAVETFEVEKTAVIAERNADEEIPVEQVSEFDDDMDKSPDAIEAPVYNSGDSREDLAIEEVPGKLVLPDYFSETMAEIMLMNGYLALKDDEEEEAVNSFTMVCQRAQVTDQRIMAYMELKVLLPEIGRMEEVIQLGEELLAGEVSLTTFQAGYIEKHIHALKRLVSLLNAHGVTLEQPYSAMPDELKEMAMTYQE